jgi:cell shape-determining protein MreC
LRDQLYGKTQELGKLQFTSEAYRSQVEEYASKEEEVYKMRSELFAVRNEVGIMQDEMYAKDAAVARITKELSYLKDREGQL